MIPDLVERLRGFADTEMPVEALAIVYKAAAEIEQLRKQLEKNTKFIEETQDYVRELNREISHLEAYRDSLMAIVARQVEQKLAIEQ